MTNGLMHKNVEIRRLQFRVADDPKAALALAKKFVVTKIDRPNAASAKRSRCSEGRFVENEGSRMT